MIVLRCDNTLNYTAVSNIMFQYKYNIFHYYINTEL